MKSGNKLGLSSAKLRLCCSSWLCLSCLSHFDSLAKLNFKSGSDWLKFETVQRYLARLELGIGRGKIRIT